MTLNRTNAEAVPDLPDLLELTKPGLTAMNLLVTLGAYAFAQGPWDPERLLALAVGTTLVVGSANTMNQVIERRSDRRMERTASRPVAAGRMQPSTAVAFGLAAGLAGMPLLWGVHPTVAVLGMSAWLGYVLLYTPWKRRGPAALPLGAVVGAIPVLLGQAAAAGTLPTAAWLLFGLLAAWQMPHFLAIAIYRQEDYERAGIKTVVGVRGVQAAKIQALLWSFALLGFSLGLVGIGAAGWLYGAVAAVLGAWMILTAALGFRAGAGALWARGFFLGSLVYLPVVTLALVVDVALF
ncbi:MAG: protoheme IX farnesyltransferase [Proteobacteria bacterium]|nr:protoheme IX farnesyltransferase [Pseudomonadota bacterium]